MLLPADLQALIDKNRNQVIACQLLQEQRLLIVRRMVAILTELAKMQEEARDSATQR